MSLSFWPLNCLYVLNREWTLHKRWVIITQQIFSLVVICDAKTRFYRKKGIGNVVSVWNVSVTGLSLYAEQKVDFIQEMFDLRWPLKESDCHPTNLFSSLNLWCKDLVPQKRGKGIAVSDLNVLATGLSLYTE